MSRIFILSPARSSGPRAEMLFNPRAGFGLARSLQRGEAHSIGEIFCFLSGLYFRGKLAYADAFADPPKGAVGSWVITTNRGLLPADTPISLEELRDFASADIDEDNPVYRKPLARDAAKLAKYPNCEYVLLGSISTAKYVDALLDSFGERLLFPSDFVGRGDMSRGGLLLRSVRAGEELAYTRVLGATRKGKRPPKLAPATWKGTPWDLTRAAKGVSRE